MAIVQFRVDDELKSRATEVYEKLGLDLSTALRLFLKRSVAENGVPFSMILNDKPYEARKALEVMRRAQEISKENGNDKMTLDDINKVIRLTREERKKKKTMRTK